MTGVTEDDAVRFSEYLDGEMSSEAAAAFEAELADDPELRAVFDEFRQTLDVLGTLGSVEPVDLTAGVQHRIRRRSRGRYFGRRSVYRERMQMEIFLVVALAVLAGAALLASPAAFRALFEDPEFHLVDDGSGAAAPEDDGAPTPEDDGAPAPEGDGAPAPGDGSGAAAPRPVEEELPELEGVLPTDGSLARSGRVSDMPVRPMVHRDYRYTVTSALDADALGRRLRDQFGRSAVRDEDGRFLVSVQRAELAAITERVADLGTLQRELVETGGARATLDIVFETGQ